MTLFLWLLSLLNPYQFSIPQHTGAASGSAPAILTQVCNSGAPCTITANIPSGSGLYVAVMGEYTSAPSFTFGDSCGGDTFSTPLIAFDATAAAGIVTTFVKTTCSMTAGTSQITATGAGVNTLYAYIFSTTAASISDAGLAADNPTTANFSVGPTAAISGTNDVCIAAAGQTTSFSGGPYNFSPGSGWTSAPGTNNSSVDARIQFVEFQTVTSGTVTATATSNISNGGGFAVQCLKMS